MVIWTYTDKVNTFPVKDDISSIISLYCFFTKPLCWFIANISRLQKVTSVSLIFLIDAF